MTGDWKSKLARAKEKNENAGKTREKPRLRKRLRKEIT